MKTELWTTPVPSTGFLEEASLQILPGKRATLSFRFENEHDEHVSCRLEFSGIEAFKCSYLSCLSAEMIKSSYDKLVEIENSDWLIETKNKQDTKIRHMRICFDDGPCFEFLCLRFEVIQD